MLLCTMSTAIKDAIRFHAMTDHPAAAMRAGGRQRMDGTFETIEDVRLTLYAYFKTFIVYVAAYFTPQPIVPLCGSCFVHRVPLSSSILPRRLGFLDILPSGAGLSRRRFGTFRDIPARLGFEAVAADVDRFGAQFFEQIFRFLRISHQFVILYVSILLADQPLDCRPASARAFSCHPLQMTRVSYVLCTEGFEVVSLS
jgi:hypothetical protein